MTAHAELSIFQLSGTRLVLRMTIAATSTHANSHGNQKRLKILGTSLKKLDRSTSFLVAPHVMLYEKQWARIGMIEEVQLVCLFGSVETGLCADDHRREPFVDGTIGS